MKVDAILRPTKCRLPANFNYVQYINKTLSQYTHIKRKIASRSHERHHVSFHLILEKAKAVTAT